MLVGIILLFTMADFVLYNRIFRNPLFAFCFLTSLVAILVAAFFPSDASISRPVIVAGMITWSIVCVRITIYEWDPRAFEPVVRTHMRRFFCATWAAATFVTTLLYAAELIVSTWTTIRAQFVLSAGMEVCHTCCIHLLYIVDPASQPTMPIHHTSGARVGPPPWTAYAPVLYILLMTWLLDSHHRLIISRATGATRLSIALGQLRAGELIELPPITYDDGDKSLLRSHRSRDGTTLGREWTETSVETLQERLQMIACEQERLQTERQAIESALERRTAEQSSTGGGDLSAEQQHAAASATAPFLGSGGGSVGVGRPLNSPPVPGGAASTYGSNSELGESLTHEPLGGRDVARERALTMNGLSGELGAIAQMGAGEPATRREEALWRTLAAAGIVPHDRKGTSESSFGSSARS